MFGKSSNPALGSKIFEKSLSDNSTSVMTVQGTANKTLLLSMLVILGATYTWKLFFAEANLELGAERVSTWMISSGIIGFVLSLIIIFVKKISPILSPIYAIFEGLFLGALSAFFEAKFPGIVIQAVGLTFSTLFMMLLLYKFRIIKVTQKFKMGVMAATGGIVLMYVVSWVVSMFGVNIGFMYDNSLLSIGISLFVVVIAALNLVLDFDFIETGAQMNAPKYMEWYSAFGLMITLIWLYIEFLKLLSKLSSRS